MFKFDPESYRRFRPYYPAELYRPLAFELARRGARAPYAIADVACGTGHSTASLLKSGILAEVHGVDHDPAMLEVARELCPGVRFDVGSGESTGLAAASCDAVTIGSAFHWMDPIRAGAEVARVLKAGGLVLVYEYQFPKAQSRPELNEWIRREFNLRWRAPLQRPRGDFAQVTAVFRTGPWRVLADYRVPMIQELGAEEITGLLLSQSRILHYEAPMSPVERAGFRKWLADQVDQRLGPKDRFDFNLQAALFGL